MSLDVRNKEHVLVLLHLLFVKQLGSLADCFRHVLKESGLQENGDISGWKAYIQSELADVLMLVRKTCDLFGLDFLDTLHMGEQRDKEKSEEYLGRHPGDFWV